MASSKAHKIEQYCKMNNSTTSAVEYFKRAKYQPKRIRKPIIKKQIYERHYFKDMVYVNPRALDRIHKVNKNTQRKIRNYIDNLTM